MIGRCNYCTLRDILRIAGEREVYVVPLDKRHTLYANWPQAVEVYTTPPDRLDFAWVSTMLELPERCAC